MEDILSKITSLYENIKMFIVPLTGKLKKEGKKDDEIEYTIQQQLFTLVRGDRFQIYQIEHLEHLIKEYNNLFIASYGIGTNEIIDGLAKLEYSLVKGQADVFNEFFDHFYEFDESEEQLLENEEWKNDTGKIFEKVFSPVLNNVIEITGWSESFVKDLSYAIGEYKDFYIGEFGGWPTIDLPIHKRPFIYIEKDYYCFDYYSLFDNIYRVLQKLLRKKSKINTDIIAQLQQDASEQIVADIFEKLLPQCKIHRNNYFHGISNKNFDENDILIEYYNKIFIIEVKGGSFTFTSSLTDYKAHLKSIESLLNKANEQCKKMLEHINKNENLLLYDESHNLKGEIKNVGSYDKYCFCITLDNFNEIMAQAEKISQVIVDKGTVCISVDDLRVYRDYFDNPLYFIHFLEQRVIATELKALHVTDECDHLGLYLKHNMYSLYVKNFEDADYFSVQGYRKNLEDYFIMLNSNNPIKKPIINLPTNLRKIINLLNVTMESIEYACGLLDYDTFPKEELNKLIDTTLSKCYNGKSSPIFFAGQVSMCIFVNVNKSFITENEQRRYSFANLLNIKDNYIFAVELFANGKDTIEKVAIKKYFVEDIPNNEIDELREYGTILLKDRVVKIENETGRKIGRNDKCPCGSGLK